MEVEARRVSSVAFRALQLQRPSCRSGLIDGDFLRHPCRLCRVPGTVRLIDSSLHGRALRPTQPLLPKSIVSRATPARYRHLHTPRSKPGSTAGFRLPRSLSGLATASLFYYASTPSASLDRGTPRGSRSGGRWVSDEAEPWQGNARWDGNTVTQARTAQTTTGCGGGLGASSC